MLFRQNFDKNVLFVRLRPRLLLEPSEPEVLVVLLYHFVRQLRPKHFFHDDA